MRVTFDDVRHIAALARLGVPDDRLPALANELSQILDHMSVLQSVKIGDSRADSPATGEQGGDTPTELAPSGAGAGGGMPLRDDGGVQYPLAAPRESFAPSVRDGFFLVPRLATHEDEAE
jgi:aspartyl-tRNA(Asn)/glutamyl-tRNA(Gln) amidotransferase subunit C